MQYKTGDYVLVIDEYDDNESIKNKIAEIIYIDTNYKDCYLLQFEDYIHGHSGSGKGKDGYCWWVESDCFIPVKDSIKCLLIKRGDSIESRGQNICYERLQW